MPLNQNRHVALLRGINVGGNNIIKMRDLKACFEGIGLTGVETYIQSGNVVFSSKAAPRAKLTKRIETALGDAFGYAAPVVLVSAEEMATLIAKAPSGFGENPDRYRYDVVFVKPPLTSSAAIEQVPARSGVDTVHAGERALYFQRLVSKASQSYLSKIVGSPIYKSVTIRNWNTTSKLALMVTA
jgi:uncharacterized protein (DUF1697 family)